jgi:hypothetical protein
MPKRSKMQYKILHRVAAGILAEPRSTFRAELRHCIRFPRPVDVRASGGIPLYV